MKSNATVMNRLSDKFRNFKGFPSNYVFWGILLFGLLFVVMPIFFHADPYSGLSSIKYPDAVMHPMALVVLNYIMPTVSLLVIALYIRNSIKNRTFTWWFLFYFAAFGCFWAETIGDWGINLTYSPAFFHYVLPFTYPWHVEANPAWMPFGYGFFWGIHAFVLLWLTKWIMRKTQWSFTKSVFIFALPFGYLWDFAFEGLATYCGWWTYTPALGPYIHWPLIGGLGNFPLLFPAFFPMFIFPTFITFFVGEPLKTPYSPGRIERLFNLTKLLPNTHPGSPNYTGVPDARPSSFAWRYELTRLLAWWLVFFVSFMTLMIVPANILRYVYYGLAGAGWSGGTVPYMPSPVFTGDVTTWVVIGGMALLIAVIVIGVRHVWTHKSSKATNELADNII